MININEEIVDKVLERYSKLASIIKEQRNNSFRENFSNKKMIEAETLIKDYERKNSVT